MSFYRAQVSVPYDTGAAADASVNTFHFVSDDAGSQALELTDLLVALTTLYQSWDATFSENVLSPALVKFYDMEDPTPRVPIAEEQIILTPGTTSLPNQLAIVASLRCALTSGQPRARRRGRLYVGPLISTAVTDTTGDTQVPTAIRDNIGNPLGLWIPTVPAPLSLSSIVWCVFSVSEALGLAVGQPHPTPEPTFTSAELGQGFNPVTSVRVYDRVGVQRKRRTRTTTFSSYT